MAPSTPAKIDPDRSVQSDTVLPAQQAKFLPDDLPVEMRASLAQHGWKLSDFKQRVVPHHWKISWEDLCTLITKDPKTLASPLLGITAVSAMPEAPVEFEGYRGMVRAEFFTEDGEAYYVSHAYAYADTGELTPLTEWLTKEPPPFWARIGYVETRKVGRHVVRPLPLDIELR